MLDAQPEQLTQPDQAQASQPVLRPHESMWAEAIRIIVMILTIYTGINLITARAIVEGESMLPNFDTNQLIIVSRIAYFFGAPQRGDVVVLHNPSFEEEDYIKRVIGLPGETITITGGKVSINGKQIDEPYLAPENYCERNCDGSWTLEADQYFVLGDNRANSRDSHVFGPIKRELIVGQAWLRYFPFDRFGLISHPRYS